MRSATLMNSEGGTSPPSRMHSTRQYFKTDDPVCRQIDLRLIDDGQRFVLKGMMEISADGDLAAKQLVERFRMKALGIGRFLLRDTWRPLGAISQSSAQVEFPIKENTDARRHPHIAVCGGKRYRQRPQDLLRQNRRMGGILKTCHEDRELVTAETGDRVRRPHEEPQAFREFAQDAISDLSSEPSLNCSKRSRST